MSDPTRYNVKCGEDGYQVVESLGGEWVRNSDYLRLKSEVERLEHQVRYWRIEAECDHGRWLRCLEDLENLRKIK